MVKSGKLPPLPSNISPALKLVIKAMLSLNVRVNWGIMLTVACAPPVDARLA